MKGLRMTMVHFVARCSKGNIVPGEVGSLCERKMTRVRFQGSG